MYRVGRGARGPPARPADCGWASHQTGIELSPARVIRACRPVVGWTSTTPSFGVISKIATYAARFVCTGTTRVDGRPSATSSAGSTGAGAGAGTGAGAGAGGTG